MRFDTRLPPGWRWETIESVQAAEPRPVVTGPFGSAIGSRFFVDEGVPVIRGNNLSSDRRKFIDDGFVFLTEEKAAEFRKLEAHPGDLVFTAAGTIGQVGLIPKQPRFPRYIISNKQMRARLDTSVVEPLFAYYWFTEPYVRDYICSRNTGSTIPLINLSVLRGLPLPVPPLDAQRAILGVVATLDDRIDLLRQTNATLESIAQALFKSWFVDFDPVHARQAGCEPEGMDAATAALFPAEFEESALGLIPKGWWVSEVGQAAECVGGGTPSTKEATYWEPPVHSWATPKDLSGLGSPVLWATERCLSDAGLKKVSSGILPPGTLMMSSRAPIGYLAIAKIPVAVNQGFIAMRPGGLLPPVYLYFWCQANMDAIKQKANGSTFMEISKAAFRPISLVLPPREVVASFAEIAGALFERIAANEQQRAGLTDLRDTLLPRLISGKLRLSDAQSQLEEAIA